MSKQKYVTGQRLFFIDFPGYTIYEAIVNSYEPSTKLYKINYRIPGLNEVFFNDVYENDLVHSDEILKEENSINQGLPKGFNNHSLPAYIFVSDNKFYVGTINFAGQWRDQNSDQFIKDVTHWYYREGFSDTGTGNVRFYDEGEKQDDPVKS